MFESTICFLLWYFARYFELYIALRLALIVRKDCQMSVCRE